MSAQPLSPPLQRSLRFFHVPVPTPPSASLAGRFPDTGRDMGLPCFVSMPEWVRSIPFRRGLDIHDRRTRTSCTGSVPFWVSLSASLACWASRRLSGFRIRCPYHSILAPNRVDARSPTVLSRFRWQPFGCGYIVSGASHRRVTATACPGRILLVKQQVSSRLSPLRQTLERLHVAPS